MAYREFEDIRGRRWTAWDVYPTLTERRKRGAEGPPPEGRERRRYVERRVYIRPTMSQGWLAFEASDGERRRLIPIPPAWATAPPEQLREWLATADPAPAPRRLLE